MNEFHEMILTQTTNNFYAEERKKTIFNKNKTIQRWNKVLPFIPRRYADEPRGKNTSIIKFLARTHYNNQRLI